MKNNKKKTEVPVSQETENTTELTRDDPATDLDTDLDDDGNSLPEIEVTDDEPAPDAVSVLTMERDDLKDQLLRSRAEFENYRKRMLRESERIRKTAAEGLMRDLLPIVDNLERALSHVEDKSDGFTQGVELVVKQFADVLSAGGLEPIPAKGEVFNPNFHEALTQQPSDEYPADTVMEEFQRGYRMGDFVLRPSQVVVSSGPAEAADVSAPDAVETTE